MQNFFRIIILINGLMSIQTNLIAQITNLKHPVLVKDVNSFYNDIKNSGTEKSLLFYSDGVAKTGLLLWMKNNKNFGIAFTKTSTNNLEIRKINKKILKKCKLLNNYFDSIYVLKANDNKQIYQMNHDYSVMWISYNENAADTISINMGTLNKRVNSFWSSLCLKYLKIHDITMHSAKRKRIDGLNCN